MKSSLAAAASLGEVVTLDTVAEIETPEHVRFRHRIAGPSRRALAYVADVVVRFMLALAFVILAAVGGLLSSGDAAQLGQGVILLILFLLEWGYYVFFDVVWNGQSPGKRLFKLRVVSAEGHPLTFVQSLLRNLVRAADFLPSAYAIGGVIMASDARFRRLGDMVAGTIVIVEDPGALGDPIVLDPPPLAEELSRLPSRLPLSGDEIDAIELFLRRSARLGANRQNELAELLAPTFAKRLGVGVRQPARFLALLHWRAQHETEEPSEQRRGLEPKKHARRAARAATKEPSA